VEAYVGIGGPLLGTFAAVVVLGAAYATGSALLFAGASVGFFLNLFNMLPLSPLDGGRIAGAISRWFWALGLVMAVGFFFLTWHPILVIIILLGVLTIWSSWKRPVPGYYDISIGQRVGMGAAYFALLAGMVLGMNAADGQLSDVAGLQMAALAGVHTLGGVVLDRWQARPGQRDHTP
jgi:Zn-dependent protease